VSGGAASSKKGNFTNSLSSVSNVCDMAKLRVIVDCRPADAAPNLLVHVSVLQCCSMCCSVLQCDVACCSVLQCDAVCCSVLQCGEYVLAVCCTAAPTLNLLVREC